MGIAEFTRSIDWEQESYPEYGDFAVLPFFALLFPSVRFFLDRFLFEVQFNAEFIRGIWFYSFVWQLDRLTHKQSYVLGSLTFRVPGLVELAGRPVKNIKHKKKLCMWFCCRVMNDFTLWVDSDLRFIEFMPVPFFFFEHILVLDGFGFKSHCTHCMWQKNWYLYLWAIDISTFNVLLGELDSSWTFWDRVLSTNFGF